MTQGPTEPPPSGQQRGLSSGLGYVPPGSSARGSTRWLALGLSLLWLALVGLFTLALPQTTRAWVFPQGGGLSIAVSLIGLALPLALIWVVASTSRALRDLRDEAARLKITIDGLKAAQQSRARLPFGGSASTGPSLRAKPGAPFRSADRRPISAEIEPRLELGPSPADEVKPLDLAVVALALNFPDSPDDHAGVRALRLALENREMAKMIRSAQDVLTLLSQDGVYIDDLPSVPAPAASWRLFAAGERGAQIASLRQIGGPEILARIGARMRSDTIFRDAAHHFLRQFDRTFGLYEQVADDDDITALARSRTSRAFLLIGRVTGTFV